MGTRLKTTYTYHWVNVKSKAKGTKTIDCYTHDEFKLKLSLWNSLPTNFKYWESVDKSN